MKIFLSVVLLISALSSFAASSDKSFGVLLGARSVNIDSTSLPANSAFQTYTSNPITQYEVGFLYHYYFGSTLGLRTGLMYSTEGYQAVSTGKGALTGTNLTTTSITKAYVIPLQFLINIGNQFNFALGGFYWTYAAFSSSVDYASGLSVGMAAPTNTGAPGAGFGPRVGFGYKPAERIEIDMAYEPNVFYQYATSSATFTNYALDFIIKF